MKEAMCFAQVCWFHIELAFSPTYSVLSLGEGDVSSRLVNVSRLLGLSDVMKGARARIRHLVTCSQSHVMVKVKASR
jgi:hypothetical protein